MSKKARQIMTRYEKGYVTDEQLEKYLELGAISQEEYDTIYSSKHMNNTDDQKTGKTWSVEDVPYVWMEHVEQELSDDMQVSEWSQMGVYI